MIGLTFVICSRAQLQQINCSMSNNNQIYLEIYPIQACWSQEKTLVLLWFRLTGTQKQWAPAYPTSHIWNRQWLIKNFGEIKGVPFLYSFNLLFESNIVHIHNYIVVYNSLIFNILRRKKELYWLYYMANVRKVTFAISFIIYYSPFLSRSILFSINLSVSQWNLKNKGFQWKSLKRNRCISFITSVYSFLR